MLYDLTVDYNVAERNDATDTRVSKESLKIRTKIRRDILGNTKEGEHSIYKVKDLSMDKICEKIKKIEKLLDNLKDRLKITIESK